MTDQFEIEKGIPVPPRKAGKGSTGESKYPFAEMAVGDSFAVARSGKKVGRSPCATQNAVNSRAQGWVKKNNPSAKFTIRIIDDKTVRCWRIA
jgi:hypothetical protein